MSRRLFAITVFAVTLAAVVVAGANPIDDATDLLVRYVVENGETLLKGPSLAKFVEQDLFHHQGLYSWTYDALQACRSGGSFEGKAVTPTIVGDIIQFSEEQAAAHLAKYDVSETDHRAPATTSYEVFYLSQETCDQVLSALAFRLCSRKAIGAAIDSWRAAHETTAADAARLKALTEDAAASKRACDAVVALGEVNGGVNVDVVRSALQHEESHWSAGKIALNVPDRDLEALRDEEL